VCTVSERQHRPRAIAMLDDSLLTVVTLRLDVGFTGIDQEYEHPSNPELILKAGELSVDECVQQLVQLLATKVCHYVSDRRIMSTV